MSNLNLAQFIGHLAADPELKYTPSGQPVCNFRIGVSSSWNDKQGQKQEKTEWVSVVAWGKTGEACAKFLSKGRQVYVAGRMETRTWEKDGTKHYKTEIIATDVQFLGKGDGEARSEPRTESSAPATNHGGSDPDDSLPF